jgi:hypothetical protein
METCSSHILVQMAVVCAQLYVNDKDVMHCIDRERRGKVKGRKGRKGVREEDIKETFPHWI